MEGDEKAEPVLAGFFTEAAVMHAHQYSGLFTLERFGDIFYG